MTPQELKNSILQLAIQGKLVEQRSKEGTGEELYQTILVKRQLLVKAGKFKKEKSLPENNAHEVPFDIPDNWKWVLLEEIAKKPIKRGKSPAYTTRSNTLVFAQKCNTRKGGIDLSLALFLDETKLKKYESDDFLCDKDIVINSTGGGTMGRVGFYTNADNADGKPITPDSHVTTVRVFDDVFPEYIYYVMKTYQPYLEKQGSGSTNQTELNSTVIRSLYIPLPPLAEQKRIVAKIEELLPYIDRYEKAWSRLEDFNKRFPVDMQKSILQMAIQGKLVEQRPEEGTGEELYQQIQAEKQKLIKEGKIKKEKPLPEISEDEIPFDIPESWMWVRMGDLAQLITKGSSPKWQGIRYVERGLLFVTSENVGVNALLLDNKKYVEERFTQLSPRSQLMKGDLLTNIVGASIGRTAVYNLDEPANINQAVCIIRLIDRELIRYILMYLNSTAAYNIMMSDKVDTARANISLTNICNFIVPLPPLAEQKRIVAQLEEILPLCDRLK